MTTASFLRMSLFLACFAFTSCQTATPEKSFDVAVLNSNMLVGFANDGFWRELESPSVKMGKSKDEIIPMQRSEVIDAKVKFVEENLDKLKTLGQTDDNKEIVQASLALYQFVLPVYKNEYAQVAKALDGGASKETAAQEATAIHDKYAAKFESLYNALINNGKLYAEKHHIDVKWAM